MPDQQFHELTQLLFRQNEKEVLNDLLMVLLTVEERESISARMAILESLLWGGESQRQMSSRLGVSIATITRGSNNLKTLNNEERELLKNQLGVKE